MWPNLKSFLMAMLLAFAWLLLASSINHWIVNSMPHHVKAILFYPLLAIQGGYFLVAVSSLTISAYLLLSVLLIWHGRLYRFIGLQLIYFLVVLVFGTCVTVLIYGYLFAGFSHFLPSPRYIFPLFKLAQSSGNHDFALSAGIGFGLTLLIYVLYVFRVLFNCGQQLGKARFGHGLDMYRARLFSSTGFVLGDSFYGKLKFPGFEPIIFVSGTGGGKTKAVVIPNMFELTNENIVVTDIKGEIYDATHRYRRSLGHAIYRFEPASKDTAKYNPLGLIRKTHIDEDLDIIFKTLIPDSHDPLWSDASRNIAKMLVMYEFIELKKTPTLQGIYQTICKPSFIESIEAMYETIQDGRIANLFGKFLSAREKTRRDLLLNAQEYLSKFDSPNLAYATSGNDFDFRELRTKPMTIYLVMPANTETFGAISAIFFEQMIRLTTERNEPKVDEYSINAIIDEFANLPKMPSIAKGVSFLRSYRIRVCAFIQQIAQLKEVYGEHRKESFMSAPIKVAFNVTSKLDADYFSALAGKKTITVKNKTIHHNMSVNVSSHRQYRDLLTPDEVMRLHKSQLLIYCTGYQVIKVKKNFWFHDKHYKKLLK